MTVETPTVNWGEWPIVAIVLFVVIIFAIAAWVVVRWLLVWQSQDAEKSRQMITEEAERSRKAIAAEAEKSRQMVIEEAERNRRWQEDQQKNWQTFLVEHDARRDAQNEKRDVILQRVVDALNSLQVTNDQLVKDVKVHHAVVEKLAESSRQEKTKGAMR